MSLRILSLKMELILRRLETACLETRKKRNTAVSEMAWKVVLSLMSIWVEWSTWFVCWRGKELKSMREEKEGENFEVTNFGFWMNVYISGDGAGFRRFERGEGLR